MVKPFEPLKDLDQKSLSAYTRYCVGAGLVDDSTLEGEYDVDYYYSHFFFLIHPSNAVIYDWTLSPKEFDRFLQMARKTEKKRKAQQRRDKYGG